MKNQAFMLVSPEDKQKKLYTVLRNRTQDGLNGEELRYMALSTRLNQQYQVFVYTDPLSFRTALVLKAGDGRRDQGQIVFGQALFGWDDDENSGLGELFDEERAAAAIIRRYAAATHTIHIYLPRQRKGATGS